MSQLNYPTLPNFGNPELLQELRFHLKELYWDLTSLVKEIEELLVNFTNTSQAFHQLRFRMVDITSGIEHDVTYHLAEAVKLTGQALEKSSLQDVGAKLAEREINWENNTIKLPSDGQTDAPARLKMELQELALNLRCSLDIVKPVVNYQGGEKTEWEKLEDKLKQLTEVLGTRSLLGAEKLYGQAFRLDRTANPLKQAEEDYWQMLSIPLRENYHPDARSLDICPNCGAKLTRDDRTFDGSYCEECRTAWLDPARNEIKFDKSDRSCQEY